MSIQVALLLALFGLMIIGLILGQELPLCSAVPA